MSTSRDTETSLFELLTKSIKERDEDAPMRPAELENELRALQCSDPESLGKWIAANDFPFLIETLTLDDSVFALEFPGIGLTLEERKKLASALEDHCERCPRCGLKRAYDLEWQARVDRALAENREIIVATLARGAGEQ